MPLDVNRLVRDADVVFLALPEAASAELAPTCSNAAFASSISQVRSDPRRGQSKRWYPATATLPDGTVYGMTEGHQDAIRSAAGLNPGCYPTAALLALEPLAAPACSTGRFVSTRSRRLGAGKTPSIARTSPRITECRCVLGLLPPTRRGIEQELGHGDLRPAPRAAEPRILETIYGSLHAEHDRATGRRRARRRVHGRAVRPPDRRRLAGDQARGAHQLLRHRLEGDESAAASSWWR